MIIKEEKATWIPPLDQAPSTGCRAYGWLDLEDEIWLISNLHHYDDYGVSLETYTITNGKEEKEI